MDVPIPPLSPPQPAVVVGAGDELSPTRHRLLAWLQAQHDEERLERRNRQANGLFSLSADERSLVMIAAAGLLVMLTLLATHSPAATRQTVRDRAAMDDAWLSQWMVRGAEQAWSEHERAALHNKLAAAIHARDSWTDDESKEDDTPTVSSTQPPPAIVPAVPPNPTTTAIITATPTTTSTATTDSPTGLTDDSSPLPLAPLSSSAAVTESRFHGIPAAVLQRTEPNERGQRRRCGEHGQLVIQENSVRACTAIGDDAM